MSLGEATRRSVLERANYCCEYCLSQQRLSHADFSVEHIVPRSRGGTDVLANLALSCQACNNRKYTIVEIVDPVTGETVPVYNPRRHYWHHHFT